MKVLASPALPGSRRKPGKPGTLSDASIPASARLAPPHDASRASGASIIDVISHEHLLGPYFEGSSWDHWRAVLRAAYALPMTKRDLTLFREVAGDRAPPKHPLRERFCQGSRHCPLAEEGLGGL